MASQTFLPSFSFTPEQKLLLESHPLTTFRETHRTQLQMINLDSIATSSTLFPPTLCSRLVWFLLDKGLLTSIRIGDSQSLSELTEEMMKSWSRNPCPDELYDLVVKAGYNVPDIDVWIALVDLVVAFHFSPCVPGDSSPKSSGDSATRISTNLSTLQHLHNSWTSNYFDPSLQVLRQVIKEARVQFFYSEPQYYAKTLLFLQSSGMGKSRLVDKFGETCPMINFVLRNPGTHGYPPPDGEILSFLLRKMQTKEREKILASPRKDNVTSKAYETTPTPKGHSMETDVVLSEIGMHQDPIVEAAMALSCSSLQDADTTMVDAPSPANEDFHDQLVRVTWNHTRAAALLQASLEKCNNPTPNCRVRHC